MHREMDVDNYDDDYSGSGVSEVYSSYSDYDEDDSDETYDHIEYAETASPSSLSSSPPSLSSVENNYPPEEIVEEPQPSTSGLLELATQAPVIVDGSDIAQHVSNIMPSSNIEPAGKNEDPLPTEIKHLENTQGSEEEGVACPICFEMWDNSGLHRLVNLKCGHLFGQSCIEKWLKGNGQRCPQCNLKARKADIRNVYAPTVKVRDTTERDQTLRELEKERATRLKLEVDLLQTRAKYTKAQAELEKLKEQLKKEIQNRDPIARPLKHGSTSQHALPSNSQKLILEKTVVVCKNGSCRVTAFLEFINMVVVSRPNNNPLFPGYGLSKIDTVDFRQHEFIQIHEKPIRDVCFGNDLNGMVLTASMDKTVKITSVMSNAVALSYLTEAPIWSCAWSNRNNFQFFAGLQNGRIVLYDTRQTSRELSKLPSTSSSPVVSLQHIDASPSSSLSCSGLLAGQLDRCTFFEIEQPNNARTHILPVEGPITSVSFEPCSRHFMVSSRPNQHNKFTRHMVYEMSQQPPDDSIRCNLIETFHGGDTQRFLGKSRLLCNPSNEESVLACGADESSNSVMIWDVSNGSILQRLQANLPVLDICSTKSQEKHYICTLTEKALNVYKWQ